MQCCCSHLQREHALAVGLAAHGLRVRGPAEGRVAEVDDRGGRQLHDHVAVAAAELLDRAHELLPADHAPTARIHLAARHWGRQQQH